MNRRLILMRHAKSDWDDPLLSDHDRPLNKRGRKSATALGHWLKSENQLPDQILCSSAERTVETCTRLNLATTPDFHKALYHASEDTMFSILQAAHGAPVLGSVDNHRAAMIMAQRYQFAA